jgi:hypothetical protein
LPRRAVQKVALVKVVAQKEDGAARKPVDSFSNIVLCMYGACGRDVQVDSADENAATAAVNMYDLIAGAGC